MAKTPSRYTPDQDDVWAVCCGKRYVASDEELALGASCVFHLGPLSRTCTADEMLDWLNG